MLIIMLFGGRNAETAKVTGGTKKHASIDLSKSILMGTLEQEMEKRMAIFHLVVWLHVEETEDFPLALAY